MSKNSFTDTLRVFGTDKYANNFDWDKAVACSRKNAQALGDAAKVTAGGFQLIINRQSALIQKQAEEASKFFANLSSTKDQDGAMEQFAITAKANTESALNSSKELLEIASRSAKEVSDKINKRLVAAISECTGEVAPHNSQELVEPIKKKNVA